MAGTLVIVPCGGQKIWDRESGRGAMACDVYTSGFFRINRAYAERFGKVWVILSAKYGFVRPTDPIPGPYNVTFKRKASGPVSVEVLWTQIRDLGLDRYETVVSLGGTDYRQMVQEAFAPFGVEVVAPFAGSKGMGYMQQATKRAVEQGQLYPDGVRNAERHGT